MSAFVLVLDIMLAALVLRYAVPSLDEQTGTLMIVIGVAVIAWRWTRDFY